MVKNKAKNIKTTLDVLDFLDNYEPNKLKQEEGRDVSKIKNSLMKKGFRFPVFIWKKFILDGAGRYKAVKELYDEGQKFDPIPYIEIEAENKKEAIELSMIISSQNGFITKNSLKDFLFGIDPGEIDFSLINIGLDAKDLNALENLESKNTEIDVDEFEEDMTMKLCFSIDEFKKVKSQLNFLEITPERALLNYLFENEK